MKFLILFEDTPDAKPEIRKTYMSRHLSYLEAHADMVDAAGPLQGPENQGLDGCWIVDADSQSTVERLIHEDPLWPTGLRKSHRIVPWKQVYANGTRLINPES